VRRMYRLFVEDGLTEQGIADTLNSEHEVTDLGRPWTRGTVHQVLTNEKYVGNNLYNRRSFRLKKKRVANPPEMWIRATAVFPPIVPRFTFEAVQQIIADRSRRFSNDEMLACLTSLLKDVGRLSGLVIDEREDMPSTSAYRSRFGSLLRAYTLVGYTPARDYDYVSINRVLRAMHPKVIADAIDAIRRGGGDVVVDPETDLMSINDEFTASLVVSRCLALPSGALRWNVRLDAGAPPGSHDRPPDGHRQRVRTRLLPLAAHRHWRTESSIE
jgi:Recombinase